MVTGKPELSRVIPEITSLDRNPARPEKRLSGSWYWYVATKLCEIPGREGAGKR
jgi:hypothetical protein